MPRSRQAALVSEWLRRRAAGSYQSIAGRLWGAVVSAWRCWAVHWPSHAIGTREMAMLSRCSRLSYAGAVDAMAGCSCEQMTASSGCWQLPADCRPSMGCSSERMALLSRALALSCDRHTRNGELSRCSRLSYAGAVDATAGCSCERMTASSGCWQLPVDCRPSMGCSSERMALLSRALALSCDRHTRKGDAVQVLSALICRGLGRLLLWANDCVVGLLAATSRLQAVYGVQ